MRVVVIGLGAMGLPTAMVLAQRGHDVVGVDRHGISAPAGSSTGETRIFRFAHDRPSDIRLSRRARERWDELAAARGEQLIDPVGLLLRGETSLRYAEALTAEGVAHEHLDEAGVARVFPEAAPRPGETAVFVPDDGVVFARRGLAAIADAARAAGAELSAPERMHAVVETTAGVRVETDRRQLDADVAVLAPGPWGEDLLAGLGVRVPLAPSIGQVSYWRGRGWERRPALIDFAEGRLGVYGLPTPGKGYKVGLDYGSEEAWDADAGAWPVVESEQHANAAWVAEHLPGLASDGPHLTEACPWTLTTDGDFAFGRRGAITIAVGCSGHGFKHAPILGEILADLAEGKPLHDDATAFDLDRVDPDAPFVRVDTPLGPRISI